MPFLGTTGGGSVKQYGGQANLGYFIKNSLRLRASNSGYLSRTFATPTSDYKFTFSAWIKRGTLPGTDQTFFTVAAGTSGTTGSTPRGAMGFDAANTLSIFANNGGTTFMSLATTSVFRDPAAWYHVVYSVDTTQATDTNRVVMYVNGVSQPISGTYPSQNQATVWNGTSASKFHAFGFYANLQQFFDGYLGEINFVDGQALTPSSFGKTDGATGQWVPKKFAGTYGTNGFYLKFADTSGITAATIGKDSSGNGNNWTPSGISNTTGATYDFMIDSPTLSAAASNYCTWNPIDSNSSCTFANGNLQVTTPGSGNDGHVRSTFGVSSGKWYWEIIPTTSGSLAIGIDIGFVDVSDVASYIGNKSNSYGYHSDSAKFNNATRTTYGATYAANNVMGVALDMDAGTLTFYKDNVSQGTAFTGLLSGFATPAVSDGGGATGQTYNANFGQQPFVYTPPTGFKSLNTFNLP